MGGNCCAFAIQTLSVEMDAMIRLRKRYVTGLLTLSFLSVLGPTAAYANTIYFYRGSTFTDVAGSYSTSDMLTMQMELPDILGANLDNASILPIRLTIEDGVALFVYPDNPVFPFGTVRFSTDSRHEITKWLIDFNNFGSGYNQGVRSQCDGQNSGDFSSMSNDIYSNSHGSNTVCGSWKTVSEPPSAWLFPLGLMGLVFVWPRLSRIGFQAPRLRVDCLDDIRPLDLPATLAIEEICDSKPAN